MRNHTPKHRFDAEGTWQPFTWEQYKAFCSHEVTESERGVLDAFVKGGKPVWNTSAFISSGWLAFDGERYSFTEKMIEMLAENWAESIADSEN